MSDLTVVEFPPELTERLKAILAELSATWAVQMDDDGSASPAFSAGAIVDKVCSLAAEMGNHADDTDTEGDAMFALAIGAGFLLSHRWCCLGHAAGKMGLIVQAAIRHAQVQRGGDASETPTDLSASECKGTA